MRIGFDFGTTRIVVAAVDRGNYPLVNFEAPGARARLVPVRSSHLGRPPSVWLGTVVEGDGPACGSSRSELLSAMESIK